VAISRVSSLAVAQEEETERMEQMGDYLVRRLVGEGGMGKVYEGEERLSKRRVALKVLHPELSKSDQARRLFLNEMQILARVEHPNIVRSLSSLEVGGELVMVLEFLDGRTLRAVLSEKGRLSWPDAVAVVAATADALAAAHGQEPPVIHRDLKPENIMVLQDGSIKVMDFGIAKVIEAMNQTNTQSVGTLQYMSPEQIDATTIDHRSDLYCLGLILYELLEGRPPFVSQSPRQLLNLQCTAEPPELSAEVRQGLPQGVETLLFRLLEKAPEDRPYLALDVVSELDPFIPAAGSSLATKPGSGPRTRERSRATLASAPAPSPRAAGGAVAPRSLREPTPSPRPSFDSPRRSEPGRSEAGRVEAASAARPSATEPASDEAPKVPPTRNDTIQLLDRKDPPRELPRAAAIAIIVLLSILSGALAYWLRARAARGAGDGRTPPTEVSAKAARR
jgi:eukaryotic-like serine/threonine-protein kinase